MANPDWEKGGKSPNPKGRGKGIKNNNKLPPELKRILNKLKKVTPEALDVMIEAMVQTLPDGTVIKNEKIAKELIQLYFQTTKVADELESRNDSEETSQPVEEKKPKFSLTVVNPTTKDKVNVSAD